MFMIIIGLMQPEQKIEMWHHLYKFYAVRLKRQIPDQFESVLLQF